MKTIEIQLPSSFSGRELSFKKGIIDALKEDLEQKVANGATDLDHTPEKHEDIREQGRVLGKRLVEEVAKIDN